MWSFLARLLIKQPAIIKQSIITNYSLNKTNYSISSDSTNVCQDMRLIRFYAVSKIFVERFDEISYRQMWS